MKLIIFAAFPLLLLVVAASAAPSKKAEVEFEVKNDAQAFMRDVARLCMSAPDSRAAALSETEIRVSDPNAACAQEIKAFAASWEQEPTRTMVAVHAKPDQKSSTIARIAASYPSSVQARAGKSCPCILLQGPKAPEAAQSILSLEGLSVSH